MKNSFFITLVVFSLSFSFTLENIFWTVGKHILSMSLDHAPVVGNVKCIYEAFSGKDKITGEELSNWDRTFSFIGGIPFVSSIKKGRDLIKGLKKLKDGNKMLYTYKKYKKLQKRLEEEIPDEINNRKKR